LRVQTVKLDGPGLTGEKKKGGRDPVRRAWCAQAAEDNEEVTE